MDQASLYLNLTDVPQSASIAGELTWYPNDLVGPCYWIGPDTLTGGSCASTDGAGVAASLCDSTGTYWTIRFPAGAAHACVPFRVHGAYGCGSRPATFCIASVTIQSGTDPCQAVDVTGCATLLGGDGECPKALASASPAVIPVGTTTTLNLKGAGFADGMSVALLTPGGFVPSEQTTVLSASRATARVHPTGIAGPGAVVITWAQGASDTIATAIVNSMAAGGPGYHPRSIIAVFRPGAAELPAGETETLVAPSAATNPTLAQTLTLAGAQGIFSCSPNCLLDAELAASLHNPIQREIYEVTLVDTNVVAACAMLMADTANVIDAQPNWAVYPHDVTPPASRFHEQWWLRNTGQFRGTPGRAARITSAWEITTGSLPVDVGVMDLGVDTAQVGLRGRAITHWPLPNGSTRWQECPHPCGRDLYPHGTPVAGIIAATGNGTSPVAGADWTARIVNLKVAKNDGQMWTTYSYCDSCITEASLIRASDAAIALQLPIVNISLGSRSTPSTWLQLALANLYHRGTLVVASTGNWDDRYDCEWPAAFPRFVMPVGAFDNFGNRWSDPALPWAEYGALPPDGFWWQGSNYGCNPLLAPGGRFIQTSLPWTNVVVPSRPCYDINPTRSDSLGFGGTSAAAPVVSGAAALLKSRLTHFVDGEDLQKLLEISAVHRLDDNDHLPIRLLDVRAAFDAVNLRFIGRDTVYGGTQVGWGETGYWTTVMSWPFIPAGTYSAVKYRIQTTVPLEHPLISKPLWWTRTKGSWGAGELPAQIWYPGDPYRNPFHTEWTPQVDTVGSTPSTVTMATNVYLIQDGGPNQMTWWWPCEPGQVEFAFTYIGTTQVPTAVGGEPAGPLTLRCSPTIARSLVRIAFEAAPGAAVTLAVLDVQGRVVGTVASSPSASPERQCSWDLRDDRGVRVAPGIYFVRLTVGARSLTRRVIVLR